MVNIELKAQIDRARQTGAELDETESRAVKAWYSMTSGRRKTRLD
jgi:hypothetical protein